MRQWKMLFILKTTMSWSCKSQLVLKKHKGLPPKTFSCFPRSMLVFTVNVWCWFLNIVFNAVEEAGTLSDWLITRLVFFLSLLKSLSFLYLFTFPFVGNFLSVVAYQKWRQNGEKVESFTLAAFEFQFVTMAAAATSCQNGSSCVHSVLSARSTGVSKVLCLHNHIREFVNNGFRASPGDRSTINNLHTH